jgi:tripartite-type tricarboxylate transporter receptor subunit TctC
MRSPRFALRAISIFVLATGLASAQNLSKPIRIVTSEAGGASDFAARIVAQAMSSSGEQSVVVDNRPAIIGAEIVAQAAPDGTTLLLGAGTFWIGPFMRKTPYDVVKDFLPVSLLTSSPFLVVVHPSLPAKSIKELITLAKSRPGQLNYGSAASGSPNHLAAELFKAMTGIDIVQIPYRGGGPALNALMGGQLQLMFSPVASAMPYIKAAKLRALAVGSAQPSELAPGLPTVAASGVPGYQSALQAAMFAPAKTPDATIRRLNQEIVKLLAAVETRKRMLSAGMEVVGSSPEELATAVKLDMVTMGKLIKEKGIREE